MNGVQATIAVLGGAVVVAWFVLVVLSIFVRPNARQGTRAIEVLLIVASALMICCFGAAWLLLRVRGAV